MSKGHHPSIYISPLTWRFSAWRRLGGSVFLQPDRLPRGGPLSRRSSRCANVPSLNCPLDQLAALQTRFLEILPQIETHGRIYFRHVKCRHRLADLLAEMVAIGWKWFVRLVLRGKDPHDFLVTFCRRLAQHVRMGRRLCGQEKSKDVMSFQAQARFSFTTKSMPTYDTGVDDNETLDALRDNTRTPPPDQVQFRIDFPAWLLTRTERDRQVIDTLMQGERTLDVSQRYGLTPGRISQLRRDYLEDWQRFCDN